VSENDPNIITIALVIIYIGVKDILAPMVKMLFSKTSQKECEEGTPSENAKIQTSIAVLETKVDGIEADVSEIKMDIKYLRKHK